MVTSPDIDATKPATATRLIVVSGMSGSGKTIALRTLEDLDYYCVDNLPGSLLPAFVAEVAQAGLHPRLAVGIDVRNRTKDLTILPQVLGDMAAQGIEHRLIFLDARDDVLFKRYSDTRRRHPLTGEGVSLADAIARERKLLKPLSSIADSVIDTGDLNVHQLRRLIATEFGMAGGPLSLLFESFAYKRGVPPDADFVFDARCLPNPHWDAQMRPLSGRDAAVRGWLESKPDVIAYLGDVQNFLDTWLPRFDADNRSYVTICIGCTGGRHRSVYLCERLAEYFRIKREQVLTFHRELE
jgi:RNase adapter protein RapZ